MPGDQELADYRAALAALMERCLDRVRRVDLPQDTEPLQHWSTDDGRNG